MRLKIKQVHLSQVPKQQQENPGEQEIVKKEIEEEEDTGNGCQWQISEERNQPNSSNSKDTNTNVSNDPEIFPTTPAVSPNLGKRKRKPKELFYEISPVTIRRRKKKLSESKSLQVIPDSEGKNLSKPEKVDAVLGIPAQIKSPTLIRAEELQSSLGDEYPSFIKLLVRSHVGSCFWMGLPVPFCKSHLPKEDTQVVLENENGEQFEIKYIAEKTGLSAGWRKFVAAHKLVEGDVLIFHLVGPTKFKVYVTRANDITEVDGALSLLNLETLTKQGGADGTMAVSKRKKPRPKSLPLAVVQKKKQKAGPSKSVVVPPSAQVEEQSGNDSEEVASEVMESSKYSDDAVRFREVKDFEDFHIVVNGVCIDSELPELVRRKYYELCCSKNSFLHERFLPGLHCKLAAGMILEAVNTADAIRSCKVTTSRKEFEKWDKSLRSFELLGMDVGFLRNRLRWLLSLAFDAEEAAVTKKYWEVKTQRAHLEDEIRNLESKLADMKEACEKCDADIAALKSKADSYELMFKEEANAPW